MKTETLNITGMHCDHCADLIRKSLTIVKGVSVASVTVGSATVSYDETISTIEEVKSAITRFGYKISDY